MDTLLHKYDVQYIPICYPVTTCIPFLIYILIISLECIRPETDAGDSYRKTSERSTKPTQCQPQDRMLEGDLTQEIHLHQVIS